MMLAIHRMLAVACLILLLGCQRSPTTGGDSPVTSERLRGSRIVDIREKVTWTFGDTVVVIDNEGQPLPADVIGELLGDKSAPTKIEATWEFDASASVLRLSNAKADDVGVDKAISVPIRPAGHVRVNLGARQYNVFHDANTP